MKIPYLLLLSAIFIIKAHAQVGIGTTSPVSTLDVRGSFSTASRSFTGSTTIAASDQVLVFTGTAAATATLPDATTCTGRVYSIKNFSATIPVPVLTIATVSSQTIDVGTSWLLTQANEAVTLISDGGNWKVYSQLSAASAGNSWNLGGNNIGSMQSLGTTSNFSLPFITNNTERMRIMNTGSVGIGSTAFSANPEALLVYQNSSTSFNVIGGKGSLNNYLQLNIQNLNGGNKASSDLVATANNGDETTNYVDLGINSAGYNQAGILGGHNVAYLFGAANDFVIGNTTSGQNLVFFTDGTATTNERMRIATGGNVGIANTNPQATLDVNGTVKIGTAGTALNSIIRFTNQSLTDGTTFSNNQSRTETFTLTGISQYASVIVNPRSALPAGLGIAYAYASAANTVTVVLLNTSGSSLSLGTVIFDFTAIQ